MDCQIEAKLKILLHENLYSDSKDWKNGSLVDRVQWLISMYEGKKREYEIYSEFIANEQLQSCWMIICNGGDGSNPILWLKDATLIEKVKYLAEEVVEEFFASGEGLQITEIKVKDLEEFAKNNNISWATKETFEKYA